MLLGNDVYSMIVSNSGSDAAVSKTKFSDGRFVKLFQARYNNSFVVDDNGAISLIEASQTLKSLAQDESFDDIISIVGDDEDAIIKKSDGYYTISNKELVKNEAITDFDPELIFYSPAGSTAEACALKDGTLYELRY